MLKWAFPYNILPVPAGVHSGHDLNVLTMIHNNELALHPGHLKPQNLQNLTMTLYPLTFQQSDQAMHYIGQLRG